MSKTTIMVVAALAVAACARNTPTVATTGPGRGLGVAEQGTAANIERRFAQCWSYVDDAKWADLRSCYASDATYELPGVGVPARSGVDAIVYMTERFKNAIPDLKGEHQLELIDGHTIVAVTLITGTMTGALELPNGALFLPTKNKLGLFTSQIFDLNDQGQATHAAEYFDFETMLGQLNPPAPPHRVRSVIDKLPAPRQIVVAKHDAAEQANADLERAYEDAVNRHDVAALGAMLADDAVWWEEADVDDENKHEALADFEKFFHGYPDVRLTRVHQWAAGNYVATTGEFDATRASTGTKVNVPWLQIVEIDRGKMQRSWLWFQSVALEHPAAVKK
jgi:predicted ester cyclase